MKLAFYYHIPIYPNGDNLNIPSYLGVFLDALAYQVEKLVLVMHQAQGNKISESDYVLKSKNIEWINLGIAQPAWKRTFFPSNFLKEKLKHIATCDAFIIRSPTPLAPAFHKFVSNPKLIFMIVGDYQEANLFRKQTSVRDKIISKYLNYFDKLFTNQIMVTDCLVNSDALYEKYKSEAKSIHQIRTTTLSESDFFKRDDTCVSKPIQLLYSGRIDPAKGLYELLHACSILIKQNIQVVLNIVGWETDSDMPIENDIRAKAREFGIPDKIVFHGRKSVGAELNAYYRMADIYVIPSYHEGFPRTIWEAMANSLPVIATKVGGIPSNIRDGIDATLINPKSETEIVMAIQNLLNDEVLRKKYIQNGLKLAKENSLETQTKKMVDIIKNIIHE